MMHKYVLIVFSVLLLISFTHCEPIPFRGGSVEHKTLTAEEVASHKKAEEEAMIEAVSKEGEASAKHKASSRFSVDRSYYLANKVEERNYANRHRKNVKELAKIPDGGHVQLRKSESGNRSRYKVVKAPASSSIPGSTS
ncbi:uncharacterized protein FA14DRAFT_186007 [Meira miltonrushii]|uniref:Uncharacterized protein n=1 Tax=Meira miltonrushii TaxID=1280837 RepID=A0A316V3W0_9BASI|nr:uncharacterized protein FA14DRAFT_186007 [Meira miltonrushii]PWN32220.1 hypothetical protein FA14DRAFT_186007 [Meira miltonrushii]